MYRYHTLPGGAAKAAAGLSGRALRLGVRRQGRRDDARQRARAGRQRWSPSSAARGAPHQRRRRLAVWEYWRDRRRAFMRDGRGDPPGDGAFWVCRGGAGGGRRAATSAASSAPTSITRAWTTTPTPTSWRAGTSRARSTSVAVLRRRWPGGRRPGRDSAWPRRARRLARRRGAPVARSTPTAGCSSSSPATSAWSRSTSGLRRPHGPMDVLLGRERTQVAGGQAGRRGHCSSCCRKRSGRRSAGEFPLLRAALRPRQLAQPRHARAVRGAAGRHRMARASSARRRHRPRRRDGTRRRRPHRGAGRPVAGGRPRLRGSRSRRRAFSLDPHLPPAWRRMSFAVRSAQTGLGGSASPEARYTWRLTEGPATGITVAGASAACAAGTALEVECAHSAAWSPRTERDRGDAPQPARPQRRDLRRSSAGTSFGAFVTVSSPSSATGRRRRSG